MNRQDQGYPSFMMATVKHTDRKNRRYIRLLKFCKGCAPNIDVSAPSGVLYSPAQIKEGIRFTTKQDMTEIQKNAAILAVSRSYSNRMLEPCKEGPRTGGSEKFFLLMTSERICRDRVHFHWITHKPLLQSHI